MDDARIIQDLIEGARRAGATVQVKTSEDIRELANIAGAAQAFESLGLEKTAILGAIAGRAAALAPKLWQGAKTVGGTAKNLWGKASGGLANQFGRAGEAVVQSAGKAGLSPGGMSKLRALGRGAGRDAATFGLVGGGLGAATAEPGDRLGGFARGFAGGALGGAAWRAGSSAARMGMGKAIGGQRMANLYRAGAKGGVKGWGAKALTGGVPLAGGLGASMMMPTFDKQPQQPPGMMQRFGY